MERANLSVASWNRFTTTNLVITPDLVGSAHEFVHAGCKVKISLPSKAHLPSEPLEGELLTFSTYQEIDGQKIPVQFWVHAVDVMVYITEQISLPEEILERAPNAYELLSESKQEQLNTMAASYTAIAEKVFELWIRTLRWKSDNSAIGRPRVIGYESGWATYLITESSNKRIWSWRDPFTITAAKAVTSDMWKSASEALQKSESPPIYVELLFDGIEHIKLGDFQRAIVDMAVACETYLRTLVANSLPASLSSAVKQYIDDANVRQVLTKFIPEILTEEENKNLEKIESSLHKLFDTRNDIVHTGKTVQITADDCQKYVDVTSRLFLIGHHNVENKSIGTGYPSLQRTA